MSPSARRLAGDVVTNRFAWQAGSDGRTTPAPTQGRSPALIQGGMASAMRDLPSPSAERLQTIEREAFAKGYAQGERAGEAAAVARTDAKLQRLVATIDEVASLRAGVMRRAEREMVRLALAMAERILRREVDVNRDLLVVMARVAIDRLGEHAVATVHLNPSDCEAVTARREPEPGKALEIIADPNVPPGGCLVRSSFGTIDAGIDAQMRELGLALLGEDAVREKEENEAGHAAEGH